MASYPQGMGLARDPVNIRAPNAWGMPVGPPFSGVFHAPGDAPGLMGLDWAGFDTPEGYYPGGPLETLFAPKPGMTSEGLFAGGASAQNGGLMGLAGGQAPGGQPGVMAPGQGMMAQQPTPPGLIEAIMQMMQGNPTQPWLQPPTQGQPPSGPGSTMVGQPDGRTYEQTGVTQGGEQGLGPAGMPIYKLAANQPQQKGGVAQAGAAAAQGAGALDPRVRASILARLLSGDMR
jgi:hypothetical protein